MGCLEGEGREGGGREQLREEYVAVWDGLGGIQQQSKAQVQFWMRAVIGLNP